MLYFPFHYIIKKRDHYVKRYELTDQAVYIAVFVNGLMMTSLILFSVDVYDNSIYLMISEGQHNDLLYKGV